MNRSLTHESDMIATGVGRLSENLAARGVLLGGAAAAQQITQENNTNELDADAQVRNYLREQSKPLGNGFYLKQIAADGLAEANGMLAGRMVLYPQTGNGKTEIFPAVVSPEGLANPNRLKLVALTNDTYNPHQGLSSDQHFFLSAFAQSETAGNGAHRSERANPLELDPEHLITLFGVSRNPQLSTDWRQGNHPNHKARVTGTALDHSTKNGMFESKHIDQNTVPNTETTIYFTSQNSASQTPLQLWKCTDTMTQPTKVPALDILWHDQLQAANNTLLSGDFQMEIAGEQHTALQVVQGIGFVGLAENRTAWSNTQQLLEGV